MVSYLGLDPKVRQSGSEPARHGRISKQGPGETRHVLVEAAWHAARTTGPLRAFHERIAVRGRNIATVAVARKLAVIAWHMLSRGEDYAFARPSLTREKIQATNPSAAHELWARVDREVVDQAPWMPLFNRTSLDVLAKRVGNYQYNTAIGFGMLVDQLWVRKRFGSADTRRRCRLSRRRLTPLLLDARGGRTGSPSSEREAKRAKRETPLSRGRGRPSR